MLKRNLLKAGDYVEPVPMGVPVTLQYKAIGTLEKVWLGYPVDSSGKIKQDSHYSKKLFSEILKKAKVPTHASTNNGTLFVEGVIYTSKKFSYLGSLSNEVSNTLVDLITKLDLDFNFFAGNVKSTTVVFSGISQIRNWLKLQGFNILPGCLVPIKNESDAIRKALDITGFVYEEVQGYFVFNRQKSEYVDLDKKLDSIENIEVYIDYSGCVRCNIFCKCIGDPISISYYEMISKNLYEDGLILLDESNNIISSYPVTKAISDKAEYTCPFCGKIYIVDDEFSRCPDTHCLSRLYVDIAHFLNRLNLVVLEYPRYLELVEHQKLTKFSDVMLLDELKDSIIETTFYDIFDAVIPIEVVRDRDTIWQFCMACNNSWDSLNYYLDHPLSIELDLKLNADKLVRWLQDIKNVQSIREILQYSNIVITNSSKKFNGSPIFRGKKFFITGKFLHGSSAEIASILRSYSGEVSDYQDADCGIVGDIPEDVDGGKISKLKNLNKPIFSESQFFNMYDIDSDLN